MATATRTPSGVTKASILLLSLDQETAGDILKRLPRDLVDDVIRELGNLDRVPVDSQQEVLSEAVTMLDSWGAMAAGGWDSAREMLERAFGSQRASEILRHLTASNRSTRPFHFLTRLDTGQLTQLLANEHPQTIALILAHAEPGQAADVLAVFERETAAEVTRRMATMGKVQPNVVEKLEQVMESRIAMAATPEAEGGIETVIPVLNAADPKTEREILDTLAATDADLAESIRTQLFTFNDIVRLDDESVQQVLRVVEMKTLALALRGVPNEVVDKIKNNMSERARETLEDEMSILGNRVRVHDVEQAQRDITHQIHTMEEAGEIVLPHGEDDAFI